MDRTIRVSRSAASRLAVLFVVGCREERAALDDFLSVGTREAAEDRAAADPTSLAGLRERRLDLSQPDRVRLWAAVELPLSSPAPEASARAERAARALLAEGQAVAVRVLVVAEGLPAELGGLAVCTMARDGKGWTGQEVVWRQTLGLAAAGPPPADAEVQLAAAVSRATGPLPGRFEAVGRATGVPVDDVRRAHDRVAAYLGEP